MRVMGRTSGRRKPLPGGSSCRIHAAEARLTCPITLTFTNIGVAVDILNSNTGTSMPPGVSGLADR